MIVKIGASLACANQFNLSEDIDSLIKAGIDFIHVDIMDGTYVKNYCFGTQIFDYFKKYKDIEIDVHLMVEDPFEKINFFKDKYFNRLSFHIEACRNPIQTIAKIKSIGKECGVALNVATHENSINYLYEFIDYVLVMTIEAGFTGQKFIQSSIEKTGNIKKELNKRNMSKDIYIDGHVNKETISEFIKVGANVFIGGSTGLFVKGHSLESNLRILKDSLLK